MPDQQLEELMEDVRATAPAPRAEFLSRMERQVEAGFPRRRRSLGAFVNDWSGLFAPVMGVLLLAAVVVPLALFGGGGGDDEESADTGAGGSAAQVQEAAPAAESGSEGGGAPAEDATAARVAPAPSAAGPDSAGGSGGATQSRLVERSTALELETGSDDFEPTTAGVLKVADSTGSIVQRSSVEERDGRGYATYDLRVPTSRLDEALRDLSNLAKVTSRTASSDDITAPYVSARARLDDARDQRRALLRALANADTANETDAIRARLRDARQRIAAAEAAVRRLRNRADRARVAVTVESTGKVTDTAWTPGDALDDAGRVLEIALGVTLIVAAVLAPFALLALLALAAGRVLRKRRREAALG